MTKENVPPLMGFPWNEAESHSDLGLVTILAHDLQGAPHILGTAFIVSRSDRRALCISAAHVLADIRRLRGGIPRHHPSALHEFLPPRKPLDINPDAVNAIVIEGGRIEGCVIEAVALDETTDIAFISIALRNADSPSFFHHIYGISGSIPKVNDIICISSHAGMKIDLISQDFNDYKAIFRKRAIMRAGRVLNYFPNGTRVCKGPCVETTIPVYSGMSGGPAIFYSENGSVTAFGVVCSDPDLDTEAKQNRSIEGRSIVALLPCRTEFDSQGVKQTFLRLDNCDLSGKFDDPVVR